MRIRAPKDFWSGVMFCGFAVVGILAARGYSLGSAGKMGPGYFPLLLGGVLAGLGAMLIARSIAIAGEPLARFHLLPLAVIVVAVCLFGAMIEPLGLVLSLAVLTLLSAAARRPFRPLEAVALTAALIVLSVGVFVYALGLPLNIWPSL
jgi:Tripartite tricarboxylate transporter TctB family